MSVRVGIGSADAILGAVEGHLDGPGGQAQGVGDLSDGEAVAGAQQEAGALPRGELGEGMAQGLTLGEVRRQVAVGGGEAVVVAGSEGDPGEAAAVAQGVTGRVGGDVVEPRRPGPLARRGPRLVRLEEGVLRQVLGLRGVADEAADVTVDRPLRAREKLVEGRPWGRAPRPASDDECNQCQGYLHHPCLCTGG